MLLARIFKSSSLQMAHTTACLAQRFGRHRRKSPRATHPPTPPSPTLTPSCGGTPFIFHGKFCTTLFHPLNGGGYEMLIRWDCGWHENGGEMMLNTFWNRCLQKRTVSFREQQLGEDSARLGRHAGSMGGRWMDENEEPKETCHRSTRQ